ERAVVVSSCQVSKAAIVVGGAKPGSLLGARLNHQIAAADPLFRRYAVVGAHAPRGGLLRPHRPRTRECHRKNDRSRDRVFPRMHASSPAPCARRESNYSPRAPKWPHFFF